MVGRGHGSDGLATFLRDGETSSGGAAIARLGQASRGFEYQRRHQLLVHALAASEHELRQYRAVLDADEGAVLDVGGRIDPTMS